jgi:hypothetical protein
MNSLQKVWIDREVELKLLTLIATGKAKERILFIRADAGWGKSELLREFISRNSSDILCVVIDFKYGGISFTNLLLKICDAIGWQYFPRLDALLDDFAKSTKIEIMRNLVIGQNQIDISIKDLDSLNRDSRILSVLKSFFTDLRKVGPVVILLDTFENCDSATREFLLSNFLHQIKSSSNISVIIAGRQVPEPSTEWNNICTNLSLGGIESIHWHDYAKSIGVNLGAKWIEGCCFAIKGHPLQMAQILASFSSETDRYG